MDPLLVVAGEASGDRAAAGVVASLTGVHAFGMGGAALTAVGTDIIRDLRGTTALGIGESAVRLFKIGAAGIELLRETDRRKPKAALLVNYTEFNARLAAALRKRGIRTLWYCAPQIWAWRAGRATSLRRVIDRMAVTLPFEEALWQKQGVDARYIGHPSQEVMPLPRDAARRILGLTSLATAVAILPGSRPHEVRQLLPSMLEAFDTIRRDRASIDARVLLAPSLDYNTREYALQLAHRYGVKTFDVDAADGALILMKAFEVTLCASGTVSLEAALASTVPIIAYRVDFFTAAVAHFTLRTPWVGLPNVLLQRSAFPELLQRNAHPERFVAALDDVLRRRDHFVRECEAVAALLGPSRRPSHEVAHMLLPWLGKDVSVAP